MLPRAHRLLACAAALIALANARERCATTQVGNVTEYAYNVEEQRVQPDMFTLEINEQDICSDSKPVGLKVKACDADQAPRVYLMDTTRGLVVREGSVETAAYVYITVFCVSEYDEASDESAESPSLSNRTRRPSSPWLKKRPLSDWSTRKSMSGSRQRLTSRSFDNYDKWSSYDDDPLFLHESEEFSDPYPWWRDGDRHSAKGESSWRSKVSQTQNSPTPVLLERPSPLSIKHLSKKQVKYVPPIHEEDPAVLAELDNLFSLPTQWSQRPLLPILLLLLQGQDPPSPLKTKCASAHSNEDSELWWPNQPLDYADDGIPWQPDYPTDYYADDGDLLGRYFISGRYNDDSEQLLKNTPQSLHLPLAFKEESGSSKSELSDHSPISGSMSTDLADHLAWCQKCSSVNSIDVPKQRPQHSHYRHTTDALTSAQTSSRPPLGHNPEESEAWKNSSSTQSPTERPLITSTVRHSLSWVKSFKSTLLKKTSSSAGEQAEHPPSAGPWSFLSKLLLSHPIFRDSPHVIRI